MTKTQYDYDVLAQLFLDARERLYQTIIDANGVGTKTYANSILQQVDIELKKLKQASDNFVDVRVPTVYKTELTKLYKKFKKNNLLMKSPENFASLHTDAINIIARDMQYQLDDALITVGRQVMRYVERSRDEALRLAGLRQSGIKAASGGSVQDMQNALLKELRDNGFMTIQYGSGKTARQVPVDVYARMVARATTREAGNTARMNQLTANGYDLMRMTKHYPTCEVCAQFQGRVYSITGQDKRFPPLSKAFSNGYNNIHPNCRHSVHPWIESLMTPDEVAEAVSNSNRPFEDKRKADEVALYKQQQAKNRKTRETLYQYERYRAVLGDDAPKSYTAFARMKKKGGEAWEKLQDNYKNWLYRQPFDGIIHMKGKMSNLQVRKWYNHHNNTIKEQLSQEYSIEEQARQAHALRNLYRQQARELMEDRVQAESLNKTNPNFSFEATLSDKMSRKGLTREQAIEDIIETSQKTNKTVNKSLGLEG